MARVLEVQGGRTSWEGTLPPPVMAAQQARGTAAAGAAAVAAGELARAAETASLQCGLAAGAGKQRWEDERPMQHAIEAMQCALLRDLFNPFRPPPSVPAAVLDRDGGAARRLAESSYQCRRFEDLPILADLLEEAGLTDPELLGHLRGPGLHCLGCYALDAVLAKS
jgi:hypothetical protein